jgi:nucleoid-associated protein YgaU
MTRETKIGLLVGLAFIIVIGILLSDHINSSTDPVPAALSQGYAGTERSLASPDRNQGTMTVVPPPAPVIPQNPVVTQHDLPTVVDEGTAKVSIGPGNNFSPVRIPGRPVEQRQVNAVQVIPPAANDQVASNNDNTTNNPDSGISEVPNRLIQDNPGDLVPVAPVRPPVGVGGVLRPPAPPKINGKEVKAEEGDTVSKLAGKYMGGNTKANREAFIKANPSVTPDGHLVFAGRTYIIPSATAAAPTAVAKGQPAQHTAPTPAPLRAGIVLYTVKDNDSLWKIASEQLGSGTRWEEIRDLNKDLLNGSEQVHANMRLKLPAKTVASTN